MFRWAKQTRDYSRRIREMVDVVLAYLAHANFPFPEPDQNRPTGSTLTSGLEVDRLDPQWKAKYAIRDDALFQSLCAT